jgi:L-aminopeptidase/D-esterase-like protein
MYQIGRHCCVVLDISWDKSLGLCVCHLRKEMNKTHSIVDVPGILVGQTEDLEALTGCSVVLCKDGAVGGVDQRGGAPGTRETDPLRPMHLVEKVHAVVLAGGSAFGLDAASGVVRYLEEQGVGFDVRDLV